MKKAIRSRSLHPFWCFAFVLALGGVPYLGAPEETASAAESICDWQRGDPYAMHWPQLPDLSSNGTNVGLSGAILADNFRGSATGPVRDIHIWASFINDTPPKEGPDSLTLELSIYSDVAEGTKVSGRPGDLLWTQTFLPGQYTARSIHEGPEGWYDPVAGLYLPNSHRQAYQYDFWAGEPFLQQEGTVYWLAVKLVTPDSSSDFGWNTTGRQRQWSKRAVYLPEGSTDWLSMDYPEGHEYVDQPLDLAFVVGTGDYTSAGHDLGDAPDSSNSLPDAEMPAYPGGAVANFPTVYQAGSPPYGPIHLMPRDVLCLGARVSLENEADLGPDDDAFNNLDPSAGIANRDGGDDGLRFPVVMPSCQPATLDYTVTVTGGPLRQVYLNVWCDWNRDGDWNDTIDCSKGDSVPEWAVQDHEPVLPGLGTFALTTPAFLCWHPETDGPVDPLWVRITISERPSAGDPEVGGSGPEDGYVYGETEDYYLQPQTEPAAPAYDWGDAPDASWTLSYPTLATHDGARHLIAGPWLGNDKDMPDAEADAQPDPDALGDDALDRNDENGVLIPPLVRGQLASITLEVNGGGGVVQGWIDFNADRTWQSGEQVLNEFLPDGIHVMSFTVPYNAVAGQTFARFRISTQGGLEPHGPAPDGEVEDHAVSIQYLPSDATWCQLPDPTPRGIDIRIDGNDAQPRALADNFVCTSQGRLTHIRLWGSWKDGQEGQIKTIRLSVHPDDPAGPAGADRENQFSQPRPEVLWEKEFQAGQFEETLYHAPDFAGGWWWDTISGELIPDNDASLWQIDLPVEPEEALQQDCSPEKPQILWLAVEVETTAGQFGWRTRHWPEHFGDDAVLDIASELPRSWQELRYPEGHPCYDLETNSVELAFCLMHTLDVPEPPTMRPASVTQCPAVETKCPATVTQCPTVQTMCPGLQTACPLTATQCPELRTQCPSNQTICPATMTHCPTAETKCPATATYCPTTQTMCPAVKTHCPLSTTQCPPLETRCPSKDTACPATLTRCPTVETQCPAVSTQCPTTQTMCPAVETQCPLSVTECPMAETACPATSPATLGALVVPSAALAQAGASCPVVDTKCPTVAQYLGAATAR